MTDTRILEELAHYYAHGTIGADSTLAFDGIPGADGAIKTIAQAFLELREEHTEDQNIIRLLRRQRDMAETELEKYREIVNTIRNLPTPAELDNPDRTARDGWNDALRTVEHTIDNR